MMVHTDNGDVHVRPLIEPWGARLPLEWFVEGDGAKIVPFPRMRNAAEAMVLVDQVLPSPISTGSENFWLPYGRGGADNSSWTGPISVSAAWQVVAKGSATSYTDPLDDDPFTNIPLPPDPLIRPGGVTEPELMALRQYGNGRIVLCSQWVQTRSIRNPKSHIPRRLGRDHFVLCLVRIRIPGLRRFVFVLILLPGKDRHGHETAFQKFPGHLMSDWAGDE